VRTIIAAVFIAATLTGCGDDIQSGVVVDKHHEPARTYTVTDCETKGTGKKARTDCDDEEQTDDEDWVLKLRNGDDEGRREVSRKEYDRYNKGDSYP
jgi:hypothetical protein